MATTAFLLVFAAAPWMAAADEKTLSAAECVLQFSSDEATDQCEVIARFAQCIATSQDHSTSKNQRNAERVLGKAQEETKGCDIVVAPQIKVVDREVRGARKTKQNRHNGSSKPLSRECSMS